MLLSRGPVGNLKLVWSLISEALLVLSPPIHSTLRSQTQTWDVAALSDVPIPHQSHHDCFWGPGDSTIKRKFFAPCRFLRPCWHFMPFLLSSEDDLVNLNLSSLLWSSVIRVMMLLISQESQGHAHCAVWAEFHLWMDTVLLLWPHTVVLLSLGAILSKAGVTAGFWMRIPAG